MLANLVLSTLVSSSAHAYAPSVTVTDLRGNGELTFYARGRRPESATMALSTSSDDRYYRMKCGNLASRGNAGSFAAPFGEDVRRFVRDAAAGKPVDEWDFAASQRKAAGFTAANYGLVRSCAIGLSTIDDRLIVTVSSGVKAAPRRFEITVEDALKLADAFDPAE